MRALGRNLRTVPSTLNSHSKMRPLEKRKLMHSWCARSSSVSGSPCRATYDGAAHSAICIGISCLAMMLESSIRPLRNATSICSDAKSVGRSSSSRSMAMSG
ncbi:hypothetical protein D9M72_575180 [compost metagenome]